MQPVFSKSRVDVGGADFSMGTPSRNDCISAYCVYFLCMLHETCHGRKRDVAELVMVIFRCLTS